MTDHEAARLWLWRARNSDREIARLKKLEADARKKLEQTTPSYDGTAVSASPDPHKNEGFAALQDQVEQQTDRLFQTQAELLEVIGRIDDDRLRTVLTLRFVYCMTLEQVAVEAKYSYKHTKRLLARGIEKVAEILRNMKDGAIMTP